MLKQRIITAVIALVALALVLFVFPPLAAELVIAAVILAGAWEWSGFLQAKTPATRIFYVIFIA
jgi:phosphatidate cytidylyltransferase